jgi:hypothetical protein
MVDSLFMSVERPTGRGERASGLSQVENRVHVASLLASFEFPVVDLSSYPPGALERFMQASSVVFPSPEVLEQFKKESVTMQTVFFEELIIGS